MDSSGYDARSVAKVALKLLWRSGSQSPVELLREIGEERLLAAVERGKIPIDAGAIGVHGAVCSTKLPALYARRRPRDLKIGSEEFQHER